ncbi:MAG TPA: sugar transferase [Bryobacteraceae bacterium]|nr:sugar transferase [Bryobacteraceae bacterium]
MWNIHRKLFWLFDFLLMLVAFVLTGWLAPGVAPIFKPGSPLYGSWIETLSPAPPTGDFSPLSQFLWVFTIVAPVTVTCIDMLGGHAPLRQQRRLRMVVVSLAAPLGGIAFLSTIFFALRFPGYSRVFVFSFAAITCALLGLSRFAGRAWYRYTVRSGLHIDEVAIVGEPAAVRIVANRLDSDRTALPHVIVGYFSRSAAGLEYGEELPRLGDIEDLKEILIQKPIQRVIMVLPSGGADWLDSALAACDYFRTTVHILPEALLTSELADLSTAPNLLSGSIGCLTLAPVESSDQWLAVKRVLDVCVSGLLLLMLVPIFLAIAIAIKVTTPGLPVFYPWRVVGYRGRRFTGYKFTTMIANADAEKEKLASLNEMTGPVFKIANDPRVTRLGRFLRKYSLNELPQFWSVLKGDMSLVGPRPAGPHELVRYELWHKRKLSAKPGITCLWQVMGRNRISNFDDWVRLDLEYIQNRSLWIDCKILARTAWVVVRGTGS